MHVISASRRTDLPAFYSRWLLNRLWAGFCHWLQPFNGRVKRVSLRPEDCLALVFWSRNPRPLLPHLDRLRREGHRFYFHFTLNGYPPEIESHNPPLQAALETFRRLADLVSPELVHWRYDPILLSDRTPPANHREWFARLAAALEGRTRRCYVSFVDFYGKTERNLGRVEADHSLGIRRPRLEEKQALVRDLREIASSRGITLYSCCAAALATGGIREARCLDPDLLRALRPGAWARLRSAPTRAECGCVESIDIGAYDTCAFGCAYCYATNSRSAALGRLAGHDPDDTLLWRPPRLRGVDLDAPDEDRPQPLLSLRID